MNQAENVNGFKKWTKFRQVDFYAKSYGLLKSKRNKTGLHNSNYLTSTLNTSAAIHKRRARLTQKYILFFQMRPSGCRIVLKQTERYNSQYTKPQWRSKFALDSF